MTAKFKHIYWKWREETPKNGQNWQIWWNWAENCKKLTIGTAKMYNFYWPNSFLTKKVDYELKFTENDGQRILKNGQNWQIRWNGAENCQNMDNFYWFNSFLTKNVDF